MKGPFRLGGKRPRRSAFDLDRGPRVTLWQAAARQPHVLVAALGSVALLGLAGSAIWMILPPSSAQGLDVKAAAVAPAEAAEPSEKPAVRDVAAASTKPADPQPAQAAAQPAPSAAVPVAKVSKAASTEPAPLDINDPRWQKKGAHGAREAAKAIAAAPQPTPDLLAAYGEDMRKDGPDQSSTSAIPMPDSKALVAAVNNDDEEPRAGGRPGQTARAVTMRSRPSTRGGVIGTVPGRASVSVISCKQWCEIVYKGKRGFIYKGFLAGR